jgi:hypothetical protein
VKLVGSAGQPALGTNGYSGGTILVSENNWYIPRFTIYPYGKISSDKPRILCYMAVRKNTHYVRDFRIIFPYG